MNKNDIRLLTWYNLLILFYKRKKIKPPSWSTRTVKHFFPAKFDPRRQLKYNVQHDWSNQIITVYLFGQFKLRSDMTSFHCSEMISYHFTGIIFVATVHAPVATMLSFWHSRPQRPRSFWSAPRIATSGLLPFVLVTDWSEANTIKNDKPEEKLHHEAWQKGTNKVNICGNVRLPYSQGKYYKQKPSVRFTWWEGDEERNRTGIRKFFWCKNFLSDRFPSRIACAELTKFQEFLKMVLCSKAQQESIIRSKRGKTVQESPSSTTSPGVGSEKKKEPG